MRLFALMIVLCMCGGCDRLTSYSARSRQPVPIDREPLHHLELENAYVRVFRVEVPPHRSTLLHRHDRDYIWTSLGASHFNNLVEGSEARDVQSADGDTQFTPGGFAHEVVNEAETPFRNITIEIIKHGTQPGAADQDARNLTLLESGSAETLWVRDGVRAQEVELKPGTIISRRMRAPRLIVVVSAQQLATGFSNREITQDAHEGHARHGFIPGSAKMYKTGDVFWTERHASFENFINEGSAAARFVVLDF
jgi:hypothetical protein